MPSPPGFSHKVWKDQPDHTTPLSAAAIEDLEDRVAQFALDTASVLSSNFKGPWSSGTTYALGEGVSVGTTNYISTVSGNVNNNPVGDSGAHWTPAIPSPVVTDSSGADTAAVVSKAGSPSSGLRRRGLRDFISFKDYVTDYTGATDTTTARDAWLADCAALANAGYAHSRGVKAELPGGNWAWSTRLRVPNGVVLTGHGPQATVIQPTPTFTDSCLVGPTSYSAQEFCSIEGLSIWGSAGTDTPVVQANGGGATTVTDATFTPTPTPSFTLGCASLAGWANTGYALVGGTVRVIYDGIVGNTLQNCFITTGYGAAITNGATVAPITTNNVHGLLMASSGANSWIRDVEVEHCGAACLVVVGQSQCIDFDNLFVQHSNRDAILIAGAPLQCGWNHITAQNVGENGTSGTFACFHILGQSANLQFQGNIAVRDLYMESTVANTIGLWIQNVGSVIGENVRLEGGANFTGQVCVQIDSTQSNPTTQDGLHSANVSLRNLVCSQIQNGGGRTLLIDSVRGFNSGSSATAPQSLTRYDTEDTNPGVVGAFKASQFYWAGAYISQGNQLYTRATTGVSGASFAADTANWTRAVSSLSDRDRLLRLGTIAALRETVPGAALSGAPIANNQAAASGTQVGATIPVLAGESYGHIAFKVGTTAAALSAGSHWYVAVYDQSGNLVTQTADQGTAALGANSVQRLALNATITPTADALYSAVVMVFPNGGTAPTLAASAPIATGGAISGMPTATFTANTGQTTGTAPGTLGTTTAASNVPWIALYT